MPKQTIKKEEQLKDQTFRYYTIKIDLTRQVFGGGSYKRYKDKMFCAEIEDISGTKCFCEPTLRKLFKRVKEELRL